MTPQTIEALFIAGAALIVAMLAGIRVAVLVYRRPSGSPLEVLRPGDAWASRWEPPHPIPPRPRPGGGGRFVGHASSDRLPGPGPRAKRPTAKGIGEVMRRACAWVMRKGRRR